MKYRAEGGGELASAAQQKSARFHGLPDSEVYTTEYTRNPVVLMLSPQRWLDQEASDLQGVLRACRRLW